VSNEEDVPHAGLLEWLELNGPGKQCNLTTLVAVIRMSPMPSQYLQHTDGIPCLFLKGLRLLLGELSVVWAMIVQNQIQQATQAQATLWRLMSAIRRLFS